MNWIFAGYTALTRKKNTVHQIRSFKLENVKNQVQIDRGTALIVNSKNMSDVGSDVQD